MGIFLAISFISNIFLTLNAIYVTWPKEYIFLCLIPQALESPMWIISLYSFIADISEPDQRPFRLAMIAISGLLGSPLGVPVGTIIFQAGNRLHSNGKQILLSRRLECKDITLNLFNNNPFLTGGYGLLAIVQCMIGIVAFVIMLIMLRKLQWNPITEPTIKAKKRNILSLFHVRDSIVTFFKLRSGMNRLLLWTLSAIHLFWVVINASGVISYPYQYTRYLSIFYLFTPWS